MKTLWGLHGSADGSWHNPILSAEQEFVKRAKLSAYKLLSWEHADSVRWLKDHGVQLVLTRLMLQGDDLLSPAAAWKAVRDDVHKHYQAGVRHFELHNEPNLGIEGGLGKVWKTGAAFGHWVIELARLIHAELPDAQLGWPGLSPGAAISDVRQYWRDFLRDAYIVGALNAVQWIGCHCYWTSNAGITNIDEGAHWKEYQRYAKPIYITEFSNPVAGVERAEKAHQYVKFVDSLNMTVVAAFSFVSSASSGFVHETWTDGMADIVGARG